jgi:hypothetical protein
MAFKTSFNENRTRIGPHFTGEVYKIFVGADDSLFAIFILN